MGRVSREARLCFILLWTVADDEGRLRGSSRMLASLLYPYDDDARGLIDAWLVELDHEDCLRQYLVDGHSYIQIINWLNHQKIDKPSKSKFPAFDESSRILANPREVSSEDQGSKDQGSEELKPSRAKKARATKTDPTKSDLAKARHAEFKSIIAEYWDSKNPGVQMPWDGREGQHLDMFLRAAPQITAQQFRGFLRNRFKSEVNHGERASMWIDWVTNYAAGPMDRFGKTIGNGGSNGENKPSAAKQRVDANRTVLAEIAVERGWYVPAGTAQPNGEAVPEPGPRGNGSAVGVHKGLRAVEPEILPPRS